MALTNVEQIGSLLSELRSQQTVSQGHLEKTRLGSSAEASEAGSAFDQLLKGLSDMQADADQAIELLVKGEPVDLHQVMISVEKTDIAFRLAVQLRNKLVRAYEEIMRMQV